MQQRPQEMFQQHLLARQSLSEGPTSSTQEAVHAVISRHSWLDGNCLLRRPNAEMMVAAYQKTIIE
jgi:hypothetical protein